MFKKIYENLTQLDVSHFLFYLLYYILLYLKKFKLKKLEKSST